MKKIIFTLIGTICFCLSVSADYVNNWKFVLRDDDGTISGRLELRHDGSFFMSVDDESYSGSYDIAGTPRKGDTNTITFFIDGKPHKGTLLWPMEEKPLVSFSNVVFRLSLR